MNIEEKIRNNREAFDDMKMPDGSRERFEMSFRAQRSGVEKSSIDDMNKKDFSIPLRFSRNDKWLTFTTIAAAAVAVMIVIFGLNRYGQMWKESPQVADNKVVEMRQFYDEKVEEAIINLEDVMENVDDSTKMQINAVIRDLMNMGDVFAEMAPLPEDRQMAITEQIYDNKLRTIELITEQINK
ncbi:MAG: hypothetical protein IKQ09_01195 [Bacteroidales bacterium]|nr:hypothetical protein [Bacteroidales bacterium]